MAIADYLRKLVELKNQLVANLQSMGVAADESEKLNTLVPKVLDINPEPTIEFTGEYSGALTFDSSTDARTFRDNIKLGGELTIPEGITSITTTSVVTIFAEPNGNALYIDKLTLPESLEEIYCGRGLSDVNNQGSYIFKVAKRFNLQCGKKLKLLHAINKTYYGTRVFVGEYPYKMRIPCHLKIEDSSSSSLNLDELVVTEGLNSDGTISSTTVSSLKKYNPKTVVLSKTLTEISSGAFAECSALTDIFYEGTEEDWNNMTINDTSSYFINATIHYNYVPE